MKGFCCWLQRPRSWGSFRIFSLDVKQEGEFIPSDLQQSYSDAAFEVGAKKSQWKRRRPLKLLIAQAQLRIHAMFWRWQRVTSRIEGLKVDRLTGREERSLLFKRAALLLLRALCGRRQRSFAAHPAKMERAECWFHKERWLRHERPGEGAAEDMLCTHLCTRTAGCYGRSWSHGGNSESPAASRRSEPKALWRWVTTELPVCLFVCWVNM